MSRILRRPMFRGGGAVDSYGMGITAPLVPGYRMGGNVRGGIVDLPGGYNETANERFIKSLTQDFGVPNVAISGGSTVNLPKLTLGSDLYPSGAVAPKSVNVPGVEETGKSEVIEDIDDVITSSLDSDFDQTETVTVPDGKGGTKEIQVYKDQSEVEPSPIVKRNLPKWLGGTTQEEYLEELRKEKYKENEGKGRVFEGDELMIGDPRADTSAVKIGDGSGEDPNLNLEEKVELSAKDAIAENQKLFAELLGADKARGQDIGDMLLRFSGSGGNTLGEKFQNYVKAESAAGPSRSEKIKQTAAGLAINDYVAGKRSKEQIEKLKEVETFRQGLKDDSLKLSVNDSLAMAKAKGAKLTDKGINSDETTKALIQTKVGDTVDVFRAKIKFKDVEKKKDKLKIGYNLVDDKDGTTRIVLYDGANINIKGTIDEFWGS